MEFSIGRKDALEPIPLRSGTIVRFDAFAEEAAKREHRVPWTHPRGRINITFRHAKEEERAEARGTRGHDYDEDPNNLWNDF